jgi:hypothetical protein
MRANEDDGEKDECRQLTSRTKKRKKLKQEMEQTDAELKQVDDDYE